MRILFYGINFSPELTGIGKYSGEMASWLAQNGHDVRVVTAPPYYPEWRVGHGYSAWKYRRENSSGVSVLRCPVWVPHRPSGTKRLLHLASFAFSSFPVLLSQIFWRPDVIIVIEPPLMCAPAALVASSMCKANAWLHVQDFEVDAAFELGILPAGPLRKIVLAIERQLMRSFDCVSTISPNMLARVIAKGVRSDNAFLFPNWADTNLIYPLDSPSLTLRAEFGIPSDAVVALYSGNMGEKQGLDIVLEAATQLSDNPSIHFVLCGDGAARDRLQRDFAHLHNVSWLSLQPIERLNELLNLADIHLLPQRAEAADLVMPSKLTGMLASGRPVVATAQQGSQLAEVVQGRGLIVEPGDLAAFTEAILRLVQSPEQRIAMGKLARTYALDNLSAESILSAMNNKLTAMVN